MEAEPLPNQAPEIPLNPHFKFFEGGWFDVEVSLQVGAHLTFHLVDLPQSELP